MFGENKFVLHFIDAQEEDGEYLIAIPLNDFDSWSNFEKSEFYDEIVEFFNVFCDNFTEFSDDLGGNTQVGFTFSGTDPESAHMLLHGWRTVLKRIGAQPRTGIFYSDYDSFFEAEEDQNNCDYEF